MFFLDKRVKGICAELKKLSVKQKRPIEEWVFKKGNFVLPEDADAGVAAWETFDCRSMHWYGPDEHYWFRTDFTVPEVLGGKSMWLHVSSQIEEWDDGKNPQFLLFVNGEAVQGIDMNHRDVLLTDSAKAGEVLRLDLQSYTGTLHTEFNFIAEMQEVDREIVKLYYDLWVPLSAFSRMDSDDRNRKEIEEILNQAVNLLDLRTAYSDGFYESVRAASDFLDKALYTDLAGYRDVIATCIGHTHIDVAWWWTVEQTREKVGRSFATVLKLMEEYPNYKFMSSQPQLYAFLKERYPKLYDRVRERVAEKRWEPEGGMWLEADCNLTSGESLVRQFMHGKRFFREEFGVDNRILWLPDVFGYSGALPQIMKKCGIDYFMTTKLAWNQFDKVPYDTLMWRGIDGSEVLTHLITTLGVGQPSSDFYTTYNGMLHPDSIMGGWERYQNKDINNDILISYGYGDGGGGPTREMLETSIRMEKGVKGIPAVRQEFARTFFDGLFERVKDSKRLPVWEGEFYFEYHRGTYTSMARNKRSNRKSELMMMDLELLSVLTETAADYPAEDLEKMWKVILLNQFHDILPGSSIKEVYEVTKIEYAQLKEKGDALIEARLKALTVSGDGITLFNTTGFDRSDVVSLGECGAPAIADAAGNVWPVQQTADGAVAYVEGIPAKGYKVFWPAAAEHADIITNDFVKSADAGNSNGIICGSAANSATSEFTVFRLISPLCLETPFYSITLHQDGTFARIYDKEAEREVLKEDASGNLFRMYEDKPIYYDNWDIDIYYTEKYWDAAELTRLEWTEVGPVRATLEIERKISNSVIRQKIHFYSKLRRIDFDTYVDWKEHQHLLKVHFPLALHTDEARFDIQFGNLTRKVHTNTSWDMARFESCGQKWMDLSEGHYGVSLLNDCKYGHSVKDCNMALTLIKSGIEPNPTTDQEEHFFTYAIYPHMGAWNAAGTIEEAYKLNQPAYACAGSVPADGKEEYSLVYADRDNVVIETVKKAEDGDGTIVRMYEAENALTRANLYWGREIREVSECNLLEENETSLCAENGRIPITIKPYEIKTIRIR